MDNRYRRDHGMAYYSDESIVAEQLVTKRLIREYNFLMPFEVEKGIECLNKAGIIHGENVYFEPPFHCEYGKHIKVGENFYANIGCIMLDVAQITIGKNVLFGPNVSIYTAGHPIHYESRMSGYEYGVPVAIGDNVWIGGNCVILPGVKIGSNTVIGAGSIVTKEIPDNVLAAGNPCKVIREITTEDKAYYFKNKKFDDEVWKKING
ncbi:MAG: sugar O-acetyltransferase [Gemmiger sp.]|uniref:sugar O-acetyltransferase n=1 Tax=Gemmiger sp. TaxID=2049027 RepID=UPI002E78A880|nr:sugar O-acetyltransferase [Gemmiger sp.]MEE0707904.1 sugar O-acetyltransferase [Gemmiger sp.]